MDIIPLLESCVLHVATSRDWLEEKVQKLSQQQNGEYIRGDRRRCEKIGSNERKLL